MKKKWVDIAGDVIARKGQAEYVDFVEFVRRVAERINNRYRHELRVFSSNKQDKSK